MSFDLTAVEDDPPSILHPAAAEEYRRHVQELEVALSDPALRGEAAEVLRGLTANVVLTPDVSSEDGIRAELHGAVAEILALPAQISVTIDKERIRFSGTRPLSQLSVVAGTGNHRQLTLPAVAC